MFLSQKKGGVMTRKLMTLVALTSMLAFVGCNEKGGHGHSMDHAKGKPSHLAKRNQFWWPDLLDLAPLRQHGIESNPMGKRFNYAKEFKKLNLKAVKKDIQKTLTTSQDWWPADWGHYGPLFIRMAWHSAGTYRVLDGRGGAGGGQQRFEPLNSWPDNGNLDKARRLLWPVKKKYGKRLSWADLMILAGNVAMEDMGFKTLGFAGGRSDDWESDLVYWGAEQKMLDNHARFHSKGKKKLKRPFGADHMGLIYVNPEGPGGNPDPKASALRIRETFARMAMDDEETVALIAGGHTFGKTHGAHKPSKCVGNDPAASGVEEQGFGWKNKCGKGKAEDTVTSGLEGAWTVAPTTWTHNYLENLFNYEWELVESPGGAKQWVPKDKAAHKLVPDAHVKGKRNPPVMLTTDLALRFDPIYEKISRKFLENPEEFEKAFARAWFKLTHRDMGPVARYVGSDVPKETFTWQDPIPAVNHKLINSSEVASLKAKILASGLSVSELVRTAWASAASFRGTDMRGGANGARIRLAPQKDWTANNPAELAKVLKKLEEIQMAFNKTLGGKKVSLADTIVIGGAAAIESAAKAAGKSLTVPVSVGRMDASQEQTDIESFNYLQVKADAFRNYYEKGIMYSPTEALVDKANLLTLTVPEMTVLVGGMRALGANSADVKHGIFTDRPGVLTNDFFVNLLDMKTEWKKSSTEGLYEGVDRKSGKVVYTATPVDLIFGSLAELRAISEVYAADDGKQKFYNDFVSAWVKVMQLDRFDLK
jgi:catalase-peroxidase